MIDEDALSIVDREVERMMLIDGISPTEIDRISFDQIAMCASAYLMGNCQEAKSIWPIAAHLFVPSSDTMQNFISASAWLSLGIDRFVHERKP